MNIEELRNDIIVKQKKGLPFICASVVIWLLIGIVTLLKLHININKRTASSAVLLNYSTY